MFSFDASAQDFDCETSPNEFLRCWSFGSLISLLESATLQVFWTCKTKGAQPQRSGDFLKLANCQYWKMADSKKLHSCLGFYNPTKKIKRLYGFLFQFSILFFLFLAPLLSKIWGVIWDGIQKSNFFGCNGSCSPITRSTLHYQKEPSKSFWRSGVRATSSIVHSEDVYLLIQEMRAYLQWYKKNGAEPFFHRKSGRVVLSLLHVEHKGKAEFVRGINCEVSLPTGSICAERAAIANARTSFPSMIRKQMKGIAVLEVPLLNLGTNILNCFY